MRLFQRAAVSTALSLLLTFPFVAPARAEWCSTFSVSAYTHTGSRTATGIWPYEGIVAVDPTVIPLGSLVEIEGMGTYLAADTGWAVIGYKLDVFMDSYAAAIRHGRQRLDACVL